MIFSVNNFVGYAGLRFFIETENIFTRYFYILTIHNVFKVLNVDVTIRYNST